ncbi:2-hydroxy-6-oxo-6-phenylhexa-2,4-dienoate hydrolase [compost metagenome]
MITRFIEHKLRGLIRTIECDEKDVHLSIHPDPLARVKLVLIHGSLGGGIFGWGNVLPHLIPHATCVIPDLPGFNNSVSLQESTPLEMAKAIYSRLKKLGIDGPFRIVGQSIGGAIAIEMYHLDPAKVESLILWGSPGLTKPMDAHMAELFHVETIEEMLILHEMLFNENKIHSKRSQIAWLNLHQHSMIVNAAMHEWLLRGKSVINKEISCPVKIIWGSEDKLVPVIEAYEIVKKIPHAKLSVLNGASHSGDLERVESQIRLAKEILGGIS